MKHDLVENYNIDEKKIVVINNPVDTIRIDQCLEGVDKHVDDDRRSSERLQLICI